MTDALTLEQIGVLVWNAKYKGQTVGQLFHAALNHTGHVNDHPELDLLRACGLNMHATTQSAGWGANLRCEFRLQIVSLERLYSSIPELQRWHTTIVGWFGLEIGGAPIFFAPDRVSPLLPESSETPAVPNGAASATIVPFPGKRLT